MFKGVGKSQFSDSWVDSIPGRGERQQDNSLVSFPLLMDIGEVHLISTVLKDTLLLLPNLKVLNPVKRY